MCIWFKVAALKHARAQCPCCTAHLLLGRLVLMTNCSAVSARKSVTSNAARQQQAHCIAEATIRGMMLIHFMYASS